MVHRPDRMIEIINLMQKYDIEPKKMRLVYPKVGKDANILLIEGIKNGKTGLKVLSPLFTHNEDGSYVLEIKEMFGGN
jgi:tRNA1(Val) A37 N6-methylase TrmN6